VDKQLLVWEKLFLGKKFRLSIWFNYTQDGYCTTMAVKEDKIGTSSATKRILAERKEQLDAEQESSG